MNRASMGSCPVLQQVLGEMSRCRRAGVQHVLQRLLSICPSCKPLACGQFFAAVRVRQFHGRPSGQPPFLHRPINPVFHFSWRSTSSWSFETEFPRWLRLPSFSTGRRLIPQAAHPSPACCQTVNQPFELLEDCVLPATPDEALVELDHAGVPPGDRAPATPGRLAWIGDLKIISFRRPLVMTLQKIGEPRAGPRRAQVAGSRGTISSVRLGRVAECFLIQGDGDHVP